MLDVADLEKERGDPSDNQNQAAAAKAEQEELARVRL